MRDGLQSFLARYRQEHLLAFWDELSEDRRRLLAEQIRAIDFAQLDHLYRNRNNQQDVRALAQRAGSPAAIRLDTSRNPLSPSQARQRGSRAIAAGQIGVLLVAGGQGTRLGFEHPKGMYPIGPVSGSSLFQILLEKVVAVARRFGARIPLYLMTSPATHEETVAFLSQHECFGLREDDLTIFSQGTMPVVEAATGKVLLAEKGRIAESPDGHGGTLAALHKAGLLDDFHRRGVRHLFYLQVDNPLVDVCNPELIGYHLLSDAEMSTQVVAKRDPFERVGNVVQVDGRLVVIEYSDLPADVAQRRHADGSLVIWAGSIAVHIIDVALLQRTAAESDQLPWHVAYKKVPFVDASGRHVRPQQPNAIKFERFIFDLLPKAANAIVVEVDPAEAFAPLKSAPGEGSDTPEAVRAAMVAQHRRWLLQAGAEVAPDIAVEISPLFARDAEELAARIPPKTQVTQATYFR